MLLNEEEVKTLGLLTVDEIHDCLEFYIECNYNCTKKHKEQES